MIHPDCQVIGHRSPLPRIQIGQRDPQPSDPNTGMRDDMWRFQREVEAARIWQLVKEACA